VTKMIVLRIFFPYKLFKTQEKVFSMLSRWVVQFVYQAEANRVKAISQALFRFSNEKHNTARNQIFPRFFRCRSTVEN